MNNKKGFTLVEVVIAIALLSIVIVAVLGALSTSFKADVVHDVQTTAESLARSEMEYVREQDYFKAPWSYELPSTPPPWDTDHTLTPGHDNYTASVNAVPLNTNDRGIQKITVAISHNDGVITELESYKTGR